MQTTMNPQLSLLDRFMPSATPGRPPCAPLLLFKMRLPSIVTDCRIRM
jgi:hypothetical protein